ncbi:hypothetical protein [Phenylobacterium sp.]|uniref:LolA family protein n=1 Tax=Phenylobacterium sp. TaxID=1871053 RepID=UPI002734B27C|nr:hypothetical protein [Phenylobacterium sp.]MDP3658825.1 hypothetical protein [Phenylobacterium sp.]
MSPPLVAKFLMVLAAVACCLAAPAEAQNSPAAQRVFNKARAASGGQGWNALRGLHEVGEEGGARYERWVDPVRYGARTETMTGGGKLVQGYNGAGEWRIMPNGVETGSPDPAVVARVRTDAFLAAYAYFYPSRFDLRSSHIGARESRGRSYDVLRVQPAGGQPRELWFDRKTGLLGQIVDESGGQRTTMELSDYRRVGPVMIAFAATTTGGGLTAPRLRKVESVDFRAADRNLFSLPRRATP